MRFLDLNSNITGVFEALFGILLQAAAQQDANALRRLGGQSLPVRLAFQDCSKNLGGAFSIEGLLASEQFIEHAAERPNVGTLVDRFAASLLGGHVGGCS